MGLLLNVATVALCQLVLEVAVGFDLLATGYARIVAYRQRQVIRAANQRNNKTRLNYLGFAKERFHYKGGVSVVRVDVYPSLHRNERLRYVDDLITGDQVS